LGYALPAFTLSFMIGAIADQAFRRSKGVRTTINHVIPLVLMTLSALGINLTPLRWQTGRVIFEFSFLLCMVALLVIDVRSWRTNRGLAQSGETPGQTKGLHP